MADASPTALPKLFMISVGPSAPAAVVLRSMSPPSTNRSRRIPTPPATVSAPVTALVEATTLAIFTSQMAANWASPGPSSKVSMTLDTPVLNTMSNSAPMFKLPVDCVL